jgi:ADP-ribose pyrophosphatase YjhB (NUDIX family)
VTSPERFTLVVAAIVEDESKKLLMVREAQPECYGLWNQPAGHVEAGEALEEALTRELQEETGFSNVRVEGVASIHHFVDAGVLRFNFRVSLLDRNAGPLAEDVLETGWFSASQLEEMARRGELRSRRTELAIRDWLQAGNAPPSLIQYIREDRPPI